MDIVKIKFEDNPNQYNPNSSFVVHFSSITGKEQLFSELSIKLKFPNYFGNNWDALYDCLRDLHWIKEEKIVLVHDALIELKHADFKTYISILNYSVNSWKENENHNLEVVFPISCKDLIENTLADIRN